MRRRTTNFEICLAGALLLALITFFKGFRADNGPAKPPAELRPSQTSTEPQLPNHDLATAKGRSQVNEKASSANQITAVADGRSSEQSEGTPLDEAVMPIVFGELSPGLNWREAQPAEIDFLRERFVELMGGAGQDPASPEYRRRWDEAQRQIDEEFMAFFGQEVFNEQQVKAVRAAGEASGS